MNKPAPPSRNGATGHDIIGEKGKFVKGEIARNHNLTF